MNVYVECPTEISKGVGRVRDALKQHGPKGVLFVGERDEADLIVHHVIGVGNLDTMPLHERIASDNKPYSIIQYCLATTENGGDTSYWGPLWYGARCVWSYYDILDWSVRHECTPQGWVPATPASFEPYHAPLGVDDVFRTFDATHVPKLFTVGTSGFVAETEGVRECARAASALSGFHFHLGPDFGLGTRTAHQTGLSDLQVARRWAECHYVAGLRRVEGLEMPAIESLCVGTRPILFDTPTYRQWYGELGRYVPEVDPGELLGHLEEILRKPDPVTKSERTEALRRFHWPTLVKEFWRRTL